MPTQRLNKNLNKRVSMLGTAIVIAIPATRSSSTEGDDELANHNYMGTDVTKSHGKKTKKDK